MSSPNDELKLQEIKAKADQIWSGNRYLVVNRIVMDVQAQKQNIITRLESVTDESLIMTVKNLLDYALGKEEEDEMLEQSLQRGIQQSREGKVTPHEEVMSEIRAKYKL